MADKVSTLFHTSQAFKDALGSYAQQHNTSVSEVIRQAVAKYIGYNLEGEPIALDGRRKYATPEARKEAYNQRQRNEREIAKQLLRVLSREQRLADALAIEASLLRKGVKVD